MCLLKSNSILADESWVSSRGTRPSFLFNVRYSALNVQCSFPHALQLLGFPDLADGHVSPVLPAGERHAPQGVAGDVAAHGQRSVLRLAGTTIVAALADNTASRSMPVNALDTNPRKCAYLCMRTTIELPDGLFRQVKTLAMHKGLTLKEFFTAAVERAVVEPPPESRRMIRPPIAGLGASPIPARSNEELASLLEAEDLEKPQ